MPETNRLHIHDATRPIQYHKHSAYHQQAVNRESSAKDITSEFVSAASGLSPNGICNHAEPQC